jgi:hypothetical protein
MQGQSLLRVGKMPRMVDAGRQLLANASFDDRNNMGDFHLRTIANVCLVGAQGESAAQSLCERVKQGLSEYSFTAYGHEQLLQIIFKLQPRIALDVLSRAISFHSNEIGGIAWTTLAREMLRRAPDPLAVLKNFVSRFSPTSWMGSRVAIVESRLPLLDQLGGAAGEPTLTFIRQARAELVEDIARSRKWETERDSDRDERFEN